jgi:hypothetical protein
MTMADLEKIARQWNGMTDDKKIKALRDQADCLRAMGPNLQVNAIFTAGEMADLMDNYADHIAAGELEEEESPEQLAAGAEVSLQMAELLKRYDAGSLNTLLKRYGAKDEPSR